MLATVLKVVGILTTFGGALNGLSVLGGLAGDADSGVALFGATVGIAVSWGFFVLGLLTWGVGELMKRQGRAAVVTTAPAPASPPLTQPAPTPVHWGDA